MASKRMGKLCACGRPLYDSNTTGRCRACSDAQLFVDFPVDVPAAPSPAVLVNQDRERERHKNELAILKRKYNDLLKTVEIHETQLEAVKMLRENVDSAIIEPVHGSGTNEGTVVWVASDWHTEENVGAEVGGLNTYNVDIAKQRAIKFFQSGLRLTQLLHQDIKISTIVLALLGDFITNDIHGAENAEKNEYQPIHALIIAQNMLVSGIDFVLANSAYNLVIPCHSGNHSRTTITTRFASENGHSLEYLMYLFLADHYRHEPRIQFIIPEGMHSYLQIYDTTIRFHHGHAVKYGGGVGGIYIPVNKAIAQWNKGRSADLDVFGHFHQMRDGGNFLCNGSLIGYNAFALSIKADFERPKQTLFLMDKKRGRTCTWPILVQ